MNTQQKNIPIFGIYSHLLKSGSNTGTIYQLRNLNFVYFFSFHSNALVLQLIGWEPLVLLYIKTCGLVFKLLGLPHLSNFGKPKG